MKKKHHIVVAELCKWITNWVEASTAFLEVMRLGNQPDIDDSITPNEDVEVHESQVPNPHTDEIK